MPNLPPQSDTSPVPPSPLLALINPGDDQLVPYAIESEAELVVPAIPMLSHLVPPAIEYATLRTSCVMFDEPHRRVLTVRGNDRVGFLNSMLTQELKDIGDEEAERALVVLAEPEGAYPDGSSCGGDC